jgi:hypothetical protein
MAAHGMGLDGADVGRKSDITIELILPRQLAQYVEEATIIDGGVRIE